MKEKEIRFTPIQRSEIRSMQFASGQTPEITDESECIKDSSRMSLLELLVGTTIFWIGPVACGIAELLLLL